MKSLRVVGAALLVLWAVSGGAAETGADLYRVYCTQCHGTQGNGRGVNSAVMDVLPRSHVDPIEMSARQDSDLTKVIGEGGKAINKSVLMPSWGHNLTDDQIQKLVRYLRTLCCGESP